MKATSNQTHTFKLFSRWLEAEDNQSPLLKSLRGAMGMSLISTSSVKGMLAQPLYRRVQVVSALFLLGVFLHLLPLCMYRHFVTQDGPSHLHNTYVMMNYWSVESPIFREYYEVRPTLAGNIISQLVLIGLSYVAPLWLVDKLFLSAYVILLSMAFWYAVVSIRPDAKLFAFLIFPFLYSSWLHMGLYNFLIGMAVFLFVLGYFVRYHGDFGLRHTAVLTVLFLVLYFSHIVALATASLAITVLTMAAIVLEIKNGAHGCTGSWSGIDQRRLLPLVAILPSAFFVLLYVKGTTGPDFTLDGLRLSAWRIYSLAPIASGSDNEFLFSKALAAFVALLSAMAAYSKWRDRQLRSHDGLLAVAIGYLLLSFIGPDTVGQDGVYIRMRLVFYFYFALILWLTTQSIPKFVQRWIPVVAIAISVALFATRAPLYAEVDRQSSEYLSAADWIDPNTTLLALSYASHGLHPTQKRLVRVYLPFEHISGLLAVGKPVVDLSNYEADTYSFWTRYRQHLNPYRFISTSKDSESRVAATNLFGYPPQSGGRVDYVLLWGMRDEDRNSIPTQRVLNQLAQAYELIYVSPGAKLVQLYRHKGYVRSSLITR